MRPFDSAVSPPTPGEEAVKAAHVKMSWTPALFRPGLVTARRQRWRLVGMKGYRESRFCVDFFIKGPIHVRNESIKNRMLIDLAPWRSNPLSE